MGRYFSIFDNIVLIKRKVYRHKQMNKILTAIKYAKADTSELLSDGRLGQREPCVAQPHQEEKYLLPGHVNGLKHWRA